MTPLATLVGVALVTVAVPATAHALARLDLLPPRYAPASARAGIALQWLLALLVVAYVVAVEGRSPSSLGLAPVTAMDAMVAFVAVAGSVLAFGLAVRAPGLEAIDGATLFALAQPPHRQVGTALTAGVTEEVLYRGYLLERTLEATGSPAAAAVLSLVAALLVHLPGRRAGRPVPDWGVSGSSPTSSSGTWSSSPPSTPASSP